MAGWHLQQKAVLPATALPAAQVYLPLYQCGGQMDKARSANSAEALYQPALSGSFGVALQEGKAINMRSGRQREQGEICASGAQKPIL